MENGPNIARIAALIGDPARALMLQALMSGRALTASELAALAGVTKATASSHLGQMVNGGLLCARSEGRHRYLTLASASVARALEGLMVLAADQGWAAPKALRTGPSQPALRQARRCYNHLAGTRGVQAFDSLAARGAFGHGPLGMTLTDHGRAIFADMGLDPRVFDPHKTPLCRECMDWSERRHHLAGRLGRALLSHILTNGWARVQPESRAVVFPRAGSDVFDRVFPVQPWAFSLDAPPLSP